MRGGRRRDCRTCRRRPRARRSPGFAGARAWRRAPRRHPSRARTRNSIRKRDPPSRRSSARDVLSEVLVEVVEHFRPACKALRVIAARGANAFHQRSDTCDFAPPELAILEVDVVDDLGDGAKRGVLEPASIEQHLECAFVAFVGEFRLEHVEAQFAFLRAVALPETNLKRASGSMKRRINQALAIRSM